MYKTDSVENLITNILSDIDNSLRRKEMDFRLDFETFTNKETFLKYIENEKSVIRKSLKESPYKNRTAIDTYRKYIIKEPRDEDLRKKSMYEFIYTLIVTPGDKESKTNFFNSSNYKKQKKLDIVKSIVQRATLLEYNSFLTDEINKIKQEESKQLESDSIKLKWHGNPTELTELIRALFLSKSIIGKIGELTNKITGFFDIEIKKPSKLYEHIKERNHGSETLFLDKLKSNLYDEINKTKHEESKQLESKQLESDNIKLKWHGNPTELIELIRALFLNKSIIGEIGELTDKITGFFDTEIKEPYKLYEHIKERNHGSETLFLDKLKSNLYDEIMKKREEKKKKNRP